MGFIAKTKEKTVSLLLWMQRWTKTDMLYLAKGGFWLTLGQIISTLAGATAALCFGNLMSREAYGTYQFCISVFSILSIFTLQGMNTSVIRAVAQGNSGVFLPAFRERVKWGAIGALAALAVGGYYLYNQNQLLASAFLISAFFIPLFEPLNTYTSLIIGKKDFKTLAIYNSITDWGPVIFIVAILFFYAHALAVFFVYLFSHTLFCLILFLVAKSKNRVQEKSDPSTLTFGKHLSLMGVLSALAGEFDKVLMFHFLGPAQLAVYSFALLPVSQMKKPTSILSTMVLPKISQKDPDELNRALPAKLFKFFSLLFLMAALYIILAPWLYKIFLPNYQDAVFYSRLLALTVLFLPATIINQVFVSQLDKKDLYIAKVIVPVMKLALLAILLPKFRLLGAVWAIVLTDAFNVCLFLFLFKNLKKRKHEETIQNSGEL